MKSLQEVAKIEPKAQELLEAAGYFDASSLKGLSLNEITTEVVKANHVLEILDIDPTVGVVKQWLEPLKDEIGIEDLSDTESEDDMVTSKELLAASFAIPLSQAFVERNDIDADSLLDGRVRILVDDVIVKEAIHDEIVIDPDSKASEIQSSEPSNEKIEEIGEDIQGIDFSEDELNELLPEPLGKKETKIDNLFESLSGASEGTVHIDKREAKINKDRILTMDAFRKVGSKVEPLKNQASNDLTRSTRKETNMGIDPSSKRFVRGVLHKRANAFMFSLFAYLAFILFIIAGFALPFLALIDKEKYAWTMFSPLLVVVGVIIYFMFTGKAVCPVCSQRQFAPKNCRKHRDAHYVSFLGYMLPTALHALFYKWFKCSFCGTSVRLKE